MGATSCLISVLKSNEKLLWLIHNDDSDLEEYTSLLKRKEGATTLFRSSFKVIKSNIINYFIEKHEVIYKIRRKIKNKRSKFKRI